MLAHISALLHHGACGTVGSVCVCVFACGWDLFVLYSSASLLQTIQERRISKQFMTDTFIGPCKIKEREKEKINHLFLHLSFGPRNAPLKRGAVLQRFKRAYVWSPLALSCEGSFRTRSFAPPPSKWKVAVCIFAHLDLYHCALFNCATK